ncbi:MAG: ribosomal L7Ae/L30e/S12e/Gadd45 family protein [Lachnospiraceae bacterium]|nr:ribosomal L7Ae/L30e/S12e/Gadd45 family protein [Lachnospiraceae bacterium]
MENNKVWSYISISCKAGYIQSGEFSVEKSIKEGRAKLVIIAMDASDNTKKNFNDSCTFYKVPIVFFGTKEELGHRIGKELRSSIAVTDEKMAEVIRRLFE